MSVRLVLLAGTAATALALTGCGSSSKAKPLTLDQAKTVAAAGILTTADVPAGLSGKAQPDSSDDQKSNAALNACTGTTPDADKLYRDLGTQFTDSDGTHEIDSSVDVVKTDAAGQSDLAAITNAKAVDCVKKAITAALTSGVTIADLQVTPVSAPSGRFAYHLSATVTAQGQTAKIDQYESGSVVGQVEITVTETSYGGTAYTSDSTLALLDVVTKRVQAALPK